MGLFDGVRSSLSNNLSLDEFNKYAEVFNYVLNVSTLGLSPTSYDHETRFLVPFIRIMAFISMFQKILFFFVNYLFFFGNYLR